MIGIFDSGYGGLTVLKPILELLPQYQYIYLGDNARAPYGNHSPDNIRQFSEQAVEYLFDRGVKLIIFACNTASATALRHVQEKYLNGPEEKERKILGVLIPVAEKAAELTRNGRIGLVGTRATVNSKVYETEIKKINPDLTLYSQACPLLVPFIEEDWHHKAEAISILKKYLRPLKSTNIDTLILGCTHYPLMTNHFKQHTPSRLHILESGNITAESLKTYLTRHPEIEANLTKREPQSPQCHFLSTDDPHNFQHFVEKHFGMKIRTPERVRLGK